jgi:hypothetical protein
MRFVATRFSSLVSYRPHLIQTITTTRAAAVSLRFPLRFSAFHQRIPPEDFNDFHSSTFAHCSMVDSTATLIDGKHVAK